MNLIILLCIPLVPAIIVTISSIFYDREKNKQTEPKNA